MSSTDEKYYTIREAAKQLNVNPRTINRWIHREEIHAVKLPGRAGGEFRIPEAEVTRLLGQGSAEAETALRLERNQLRAIAETLWERRKRAIYVAGKGYEIYLDMELSERLRHVLGES